MDGKLKSTPPRHSARVRQRITGGEAKGTTDAAPAQDTSGPGRGNDNAFPAPQVPVVDAATHEATTQEDELEASGSESEDDSEEDDRIDKLQGIVAEVTKQLDSMKKREEKKKGKNTKKKGDRRRKR